MTGIIIVAEVLYTLQVDDHSIVYLHPVVNSDQVGAIVVDVVPQWTGDL
jgi:hypothetical protein